MALNEKKRLCGMGLTVDLTLRFILDILSVQQQTSLSPRQFSTHVSRMVYLGDKLHVDKGCTSPLDDVLQETIIAVMFDHYH